MKSAFLQEPNFTKTQHFILLHVMTDWIESRFGTGYNIYVRDCFNLCCFNFFWSKVPVIPTCHMCSPCRVNTVTMGSSNIKVKTNYGISWTIYLRD